MTLIFFIYENVRGKNEYGGHSTSKYTINVWKCLPITVCSRGIGKCLAIYQLIDEEISGFFPKQILSLFYPFLVLADLFRIGRTRNPGKTPLSGLGGVTLVSVCRDHSGIFTHPDLKVDSSTCIIHPLKWLTQLILAAETTLRYFY